MAFNIIDASRCIADKYTRYLNTTFDIADAEYHGLFLHELENGLPFFKGPYLDVVNSFQKGNSTVDLIHENVLSRDFCFIKSIYEKTLYRHQEIALRKSIQGKNLVVSTGTGSGKTECFLIPILNSLMREKEQSGKLAPGVHALIIYPMNALANDQIDRLRGLLTDYPDITFGCYTGQTANKQSDAETLFKKLNPNQSILPNERISREKMKENPPHILITNYAMLEYLMLRPEDNVFFDGKYAQNWKFIVLDEAHTYTGSTGIEVSMLLRRVTTKLNGPKLQYILTSATLGDEKSNAEVVKFAENLCNAPFYKEDIIRASRVDLSQLSDRASLNLNSAFYRFVYDLLEKGYDDRIILQKIDERYGYHSDTLLLSEFLYDLLLQDKTYWKIKSFLHTPNHVQAICAHMNWSAQDLSVFVDVASHANKNGTKLFDSRYHTFMRAAEGVFITLPPLKKVFLDRRKTYCENGKEYRVFEVVSCSQCHSLYILGKINHDHLEQQSNLDPQDTREAFWIGSNVSDNDDDDTLEAENLKIDQYELCPYCGFIRNSDNLCKRYCEHSPSDYVKITKVKTSAISQRVTKCVACESVNRLGILRGFFSGQEASTSVIGTALFEELPDHENIIKISSTDDDGFSFGETETIERIEKAKQFIAFSDSRQAAAYFASYFSETYDGLLYAKMIHDQLVAMSEDQMPVTHFVKSLSAVFSSHKIAPYSETSPDYMAEAWKAVLKELVDNRARNSLMGLGLLSITPAHPHIFICNSKYQLTAKEVQDICMVFIMSMLSDAAIYYDKNLSEEDKQFFTHNGFEATYLLNDSNRKARSFVPKIESRTNKRLEYLQRVLAAKNVPSDRNSTIELTESLWRRFFVGDESTERLLKNISTSNGIYGYRVNTNSICLAKNQTWYRCPKCNRLTAYNVASVCPSYMCDGKLEEVSVDEVMKDNHYYRTYHDLPVRALRVVEHTAQLNREEAYKYQNLFKEKKIDVLSCSTTFEMGVDVGELETVFMRNMPPSPSNYVQRAGRAGRSSKSAAFALTFCNKSNHDFNFFKDPISMIDGIIRPPMFKIDNEKICIRHVYSTALAAFWRLHPEYFGTAKDMMEEKPNRISGYQAFNTYLQQKPPVLKEYLFSIVPNDLIEQLDVANFGWVKWLFNDPKEDFPNLKRVYDLYNEEVSTLEREKNNALNQNKSVDYIIRRLRNYREERIISFLSKNGILPKYGFPVDTVELSVSSKNTSVAGLDLSRDLSMAIAEYAPGCQVVANGKLITSRYIRKMPREHWKMYDYVKCPECQTLNIAIHTENIDVNPLMNCKQCKKVFTDQNKSTFLIPDFGFIAESKIEKPTLVKPERTYRTEAAFVNYDNEIVETHYTFNRTDIYLATVNNGPMAILTSDSFYVCESCGYAMDPSEKIGVYTRQTKHIHKTPSGSACPNQTLKKFALGYRFETDVIRMRIDKPSNYEQAFSVLQAFVLSACRQLNIDNNEIAGCLQYHKDGCFNFILYDTTPGGAGHVKRLNDQTTLKQVLNTAFDITQYCTCGGDEGDTSCYSCLRTYRNQRYHDILKRRYVIDFLQDIVL